jgi:hypothetical protein
MIGRIASLKQPSILEKQLLYVIIEAMVIMPSIDVTAPLH